MEGEAAMPESDESAAATELDPSPIESESLGHLAKPPSLRDVAAAAFVSVSTASMALNGHQSIAAETRVRVTAAAAQLNYRPNSNARALRGGVKSHLVGVYIEPSLTEDFGDYSRLFTHRLMRLLTESLTRPGMTLQQLTDLTDPRIGDLSVLVVVGDEALDSAFYKEFPHTRIITAGHRDNADNVAASINHDQDAIAADLLDHLIENGATNLCVVRFREPANYSQSGTAAVRHAGTQRGIATDERLVDFEPSAVAAAVEASVRAGFDSIFVMLPFPGAAIAGVRAAGSQVPADVLLVGRGEGTIEAETSPPTTAMSMQALATGRLIVEVIERVLQGESGIHVHAPHRLIIRESSARR